MQKSLTLLVLSLIFYLLLEIVEYLGLDYDVFCLLFSATFLVSMWIHATSKSPVVLEVADKLKPAKPDFLK
ncbi:MAG: hypothetical protein V1921_05975 [Candidatus Altiarchaeota archaeon]